MEAFLEIIGEIENIAATKLNMNHETIFLPKKKRSSSAKPKFFENLEIMDKIKEKKIIVIKIPSNSESALEKLNKFLLKNEKQRKSLQKNSNINEHSRKNSENTQTDIKTLTENENNQTIHFCKSFISSKRKNSGNSSIASITSNLCEIQNVKPQNKKHLTTKQTFQKKFITNFGEDYSPKLLTTKECISIILDYKHKKKNLFYCF